MASAARAIGPAVGGTLWSISIQNNFIFLNFIFAIVLLLVTQYLGYYLPDTLDHPREASPMDNTLPKKDLSVKLDADDLHVDVCSQP